jgi:uncharacterized membrane protein
MKSFKAITIICFFFVTIGLFFGLSKAQTEAQIDPTENAEVSTTNAGLVVKVADGDALPISIKLSNFGGGKRVDVLLKYSILTSKGVEIYSISDTIAVETTASFIKTITIPSGTAPGTYIAKTSIIYNGQLVPATTQFTFTVEPKILGIFQNDFILYGIIIVVVGFLLILLGSALIKRSRMMRLAPLDYSDVPKNQRIFYEILSDTIMQMRQRAGDEALDIASHVNGLKIDEKTGRILSISDQPSKIIATLVAEYEKLLGKKVSFSFRREAENK